MQCYIECIAPDAPLSAPRCPRHAWPRRPTASRNDTNTTARTPASMRTASSAAEGSWRSARSPRKRANTIGFRRSWKVRRPRIGFWTRPRRSRRPTSIRHPEDSLAPGRTGFPGMTMRHAGLRSTRTSRAARARSSKGCPGKRSAYPSNSGWCALSAAPNRTREDSRRAITCSRSRHCGASPGAIRPRMTPR